MEALPALNGLGVVVGQLVDVRNLRAMRPGGCAFLREFVSGNERHPESGGGSLVRNLRAMRPGGCAFLREFVSGNERHPESGGGSLVRNLRAMRPGGCAFLREFVTGNERHPESGRGSLVRNLYATHQLFEGVCLWQRVSSGKWTPLPGPAP